MIFLISLILANIYEIHPQPKEPYICCYSKLTAWVKWLERHARPLQPDDYVFPCMDLKGRAKIKEPFSHSRIQSILDDFTKEAGLLANRNGRFSTHCFRRGGAQHRFMFAEEKWSLKAVKWWGGWSEGEKTGTIMRYLLDEFMRYETGFGDMLSPVRKDSKHTLFMGGSNATEPVTQQTLAIALEGMRRDMIKENSNTISLLKSEFFQFRSDLLESVDSNTRKIQNMILGLPGILDARAPIEYSQIAEQGAGHR